MRIVFSKHIEKLQKVKNHVKEDITFFAWLPVTINNEVRWLETVTIYGQWVATPDSNWEPHFWRLQFVDKTAS